MKHKSACFWLVASISLLISVHSHAQRFVRSFATVDALLAVSPNDVNTNANVSARLSVNDNGGGEFFYDANSALATNYGTVFKPNNFAGRWIRKHQNRLSAAAFGAYGDLTHDDNLALQSAFDTMTPGGVIYFEPNKNYITGDTLILKPGVRLDLNRSLLIFTIAGAKFGLQVRDNCVVENGTVQVNVNGATTATSGDYFTPITIGGTSATTPFNVGYSNVILRQLTIITDRIIAGGGSLGILVGYDSHNILIENIVFPNTTAPLTGISIHWGGDATRTTHPHSIAIRNIDIGIVTNSSAISDAGIYVSGAYDVSIENVRVKHYAGDAIVFVTPGDYGYAFADASVKPLAVKGISIRSVSAEMAMGSGVIINGLADNLVPAVQYPMPVVVENCAVSGNASTNTGRGYWAIYGFDTVFKSCFATKFNWGFHADDRVKRVKFVDSVSATNNESGFLVGHANLPEDVQIIRCEAFGNGMSGLFNDPNGINIGTSRRTKVIGCVLGNTNTASEATQYRGIINAGTDTWIEDCYVRSAVTGGTGFSLTTEPYIFSGNKVDASIALSRGGGNWVAFERTPSEAASINYTPANFVGVGTPEANLTASVGSTAQRVDGVAGLAFYVKETGTGNTGWSSMLSASTGVTGPAVATDNALARFDGTTGKLIQNSLVLVDDTGNMSGANNYDVTLGYQIGGAGASGNYLRGNGTRFVSSTIQAGDLPTSVTGAGFIMIGNDANYTAERALAGTANQVILTDGGANAAMTLSLPQNIHTSATPTFDGLTLTGLAGTSRVLFSVGDVLTTDGGSPGLMVVGGVVVGEFFSAQSARMGGTDSAAARASLEAFNGNATLPVFLITTLNAGTDDNNESVVQQYRATTDGVATDFADIPITASRTYAVESKVYARRTGGASGTADDGAFYIRRAMVTTKAGTVTINAVQDGLTQEDQAGWDCTFQVSGSNIRILVTGATGNNVTWHATTRLSYVGN